MSAKAIREKDGKRLLTENIPEDTMAPCLSAVVTAETDIDKLPETHPWLLTKKLVVKPDQLIKRRGKLGLIKVNVDFEGVKKWIKERMGKDVQVGSACGKLNTFIIEPLVPHQQSDEYYVCIYSDREGDHLLFYHEGGVDIGDVDAKAKKLDMPTGSGAALPSKKLDLLLAEVPDARREKLAMFVRLLYTVYLDLYFTYLELNPIVMTDEGLFVLDMAAKIDQTAEFECSSKWGEIKFPPPFGREATPEEAYIASLDAKTGASLKLTVLNKRGRIWTMVAGGGASVIYSDTICDLGASADLANYGEYSGAPSEAQTYEYAKTILDLMTRERDPRGKVLIIGGGIANFTNVAATFKGIVRALKEFKHQLIEHQVKIFVRRGGPNYQEGLRVMGDLGLTLGVPIHVYGPETHMTAIVSMALGLRSTEDPLSGSESGDESTLYVRKSTLEGVARPPKRGASLTNLNANRKASIEVLDKVAEANGRKVLSEEERAKVEAEKLFTENTRALVWGMQPRAVQGMLDFDFSCSREKPSVAGMIYPFSGNHMQRFYWGGKEVLIPVYRDMKEAFKAHPDVSVLVNFASLRSAYEATMNALKYQQVRAIAIIAEGIPENKTRSINQAAAERGVVIIGPATVGGIKPGCFRIGNTGGMLDNIISSKLYRPGSVAYVSRSGGMSNELNNILSRNTNGTYEGIAIGGDRYPGTTFLDHLLRFERDPDVKMLVMLGEIGGTEEYKVCEALQNGTITKPMVAWCIGTCASMFSTEVQFGHAGSCANAASETSTAKNKALAEAGASVPRNFDELGEVIARVYKGLVKNGTVIELPEPEPPTVPVDYSWAQELGLIRKPTTFMSTIVDDRGEELLYAGMPISDVFADDIGIGGVLSLLWFKRRLPPYACKFIEMCLMITADHGPAVSGAHNTIVTARAGKDLVSSLTAGLLTIGPRFGGALDAAATQFAEAFDAGLSAHEFVNTMRKKGKLIMGIGHRVKSVNNPDMRVTIVKDFCKRNFPSTELLDFGLRVEEITTSKKPNLILNVDGCIGIAFVDLLRGCGSFSRAEAEEYIEIGTLNGLFVLGRSLGFIGHYLDQKRLKQGLYRHPWDDISYNLPNPGEL